MRVEDVVRAGVHAKVAERPPIGHVPVARVGPHAGVHLARLAFALLAEHLRRLGVVVAQLHPRERLARLADGRRSEPRLGVGLDLLVVRLGAGRAGPAVAGFWLGGEGRVEAVEVEDGGAAGAGDRLGAVGRRTSVREQTTKGMCERTWPPTSSRRSIRAERRTAPDRCRPRRERTRSCRSGDGRSRLWRKKRSVSSEGKERKRRANPERS